MMKKWIVLGIVLTFLGACKERKPAPVDTVFRCTVAGANNEVLFMTVNGETVNLPLQNGKAEITFKQLVPQYSDITLGEKYYPIKESTGLYAIIFIPVFRLSVRIFFTKTRRMYTRRQKN